MQPEQGQGPQAPDSQDGQRARQAVASQPAERSGLPAGNRGQMDQDKPQAARSHSRPAGGAQPLPDTAGPPDRKVFRLPGAVIAFWAWVVVVVLCLIDMAATGRNHTSAEIAVVLVLVTGVMYACALRPKVITDSSGITVQNPLRDHRVPWGSVTSVDLAESVRVHCEREPGAKRERVIHSWALYSQRRARLKADLMQQGPRRLPRSTFSLDGGAPERERIAREPTAQVMAKQLGELATDARARGVPGGPAVITWPWQPAVAIVAPAIAAALIFTVIQ